MSLQPSASIVDRAEAIHTAKHVMTVVYDCQQGRTCTLEKSCTTIVLMSTLQDRTLGYATQPKKKDALEQEAKTKEIYDIAHSYSTEISRL